MSGAQLGESRQELRESGALEQCPRVTVQALDRGLALPSELLAETQEQGLQVSQRELQCLHGIDAEDRANLLVADADELHRAVRIPTLHVARLADLQLGGSRWLSLDAQF